eukprot:RCo006221
MTFQGLRAVSLGLVVALLLGTTAEANLHRAGSWMCNYSSSAAVVKAAPVPAPASAPPAVTGAGPTMPCIRIPSEPTCDKVCHWWFEKYCRRCPVKPEEEATYQCPDLGRCVDKEQKDYCDSLCNMTTTKPCGVCKDDPTKFSCLNVAEAVPTRRLEKP